LKVFDDGITGARVVGAQKSNVELCCTPNFSFEVGNQVETGSFSTITRKLTNQGIDNIRLEIDLYAVDEFSNPLEDNLISTSVSIYSNMNFEEIDAWKIK
jgi:hypothetical protein